jgi:hypothetical protein
MISGIAFVVSMVVKAPNACLASYNIFVDEGALTIHV